MGVGGGVPVGDAWQGDSCGVGLIFGFGVRRGVAVTVGLADGVGHGDRLEGGTAPGAEELDLGGSCGPPGLARLDEPGDPRSPSVFRHRVTVRIFAASLP